MRTVKLLVVVIAVWYTVMLAGSVLNANQVATGMNTRNSEVNTIVAEAK